MTQHPNPLPCGRFVEMVPLPPYMHHTVVVFREDAPDDAEQQAQEKVGTFLVAQRAKDLKMSDQATGLVIKCRHESFTVLPWILSALEPLQDHIDHIQYHSLQTTTVRVA